MNTLLRTTCARRLARPLSVRAAGSVIPTTTTAPGNESHPRLPLLHPTAYHQQQHPVVVAVRHKHTVRIILQDDLPNGKGYTGDVLHVAAGYARNFLIPQKKALYATRQNFARLGMKDPDMETTEERQARLARERLEGEDEDLKAADLLQNYLRNKVVRVRLICFL